MRGSLFLCNRLTRKREGPQIIQYLINLGYALVHPLLDLARTAADSSKLPRAVQSRQRDCLWEASDDAMTRMTGQRSTVPSGDLAGSAAIFFLLRRPVDHRKFARGRWMATAALESRSRLGSHSYRTLIVHVYASGSNSALESVCSACQHAREWCGF